MNRHFEFLIRDQDRAFFQKVAEEQAAVPRPRAARPAIEKTATAISPLEKLAAEIDADLYVLQHAGPVGVGMGMTKRAMAHLQRLSADPRLLAQPGVLPDLFGKIAAAAIEVDLDAAAQELCSPLPVEKQAAVRRAIAEVGLELARAAQDAQEKLAGLFSSVGEGLGRAIGGAGRAAGELRSATRGIGRAVTRPLSEAAAGFRVGRVEGAAKRLSSIEEGLKSSRSAYEAAGNAATRGFHEGKLRSLEGQRASAAAKLDRARGVPSGAHVPSAGPAARPSAAKAPETPPPAPPKSMSSPRSAVPAGAGASKMSPARAAAEERFGKLTQKARSSAPSTGDGAEKAKAAATPPPPHEGAAEDTSASGESGAGGKPAGHVMDTFHKLHTRGFGALSSPEKQQLGLTAAAGIGAHRLATGRDLLTGDKND